MFALISMYGKAKVTNHRQNSNAESIAYIEIKIIFLIQFHSVSPWADHNLGEINHNNEYKYHGWICLSQFAVIHLYLAPRTQLQQPIIKLNEPMHHSTLVFVRI